MKWISIFLVAAMSATCGQPRKKAHVKHHRLTHQRRDEGVPAPRSVMVDSNWITHYQELEKEFHYTVSDDDKIKAVGNQFNVPGTVRDHYQDMLRAKHAGGTPAATGGDNAKR